MTKAFKAKCERVAELTDVDLVLYEDSGAGVDDAFEDDGNLHIHKGGARACFDVGGGQELSGERQNERTRAVLTALGMTKEITGRVLADEDDGDSDECPHCGRSYG